MDYATYQAYEQYGAWTDDKGKPVPCSPGGSCPCWHPANDTSATCSPTDRGRESAASSRNVSRCQWARSALSRWPRAGPPPVTQVTVPEPGWGTQRRRTAQAWASRRSGCSTC